MAIGTNDFLREVASALGPDERLWVGVVVCYVLVDGGDEFGHAGEHAVAQPSRPIAWSIAGASAGSADMPRGLLLRFQDDALGDVSWKLNLASDQILSTAFAGMKPQGGDAADAVL